MLTHGRRILIALAIASHAALSLCGPGHHALAGLIEHPAAVSDADAPACDSPGAVLHADKDCPACDFFALASLPPSIASTTIQPVEEPSLPCLGRIFPSRPFPVASPPRAPPRTEG
jgi:hypothetical protein